MCTWIWTRTVWAPRSTRVCILQVLLTSSNSASAGRIQMGVWKDGVHLFTFSGSAQLQACMDIKRDTCRRKAYLGMFCDAGKKSCKNCPVKGSDDTSNTYIPKVGT
ncbi:hypothetical protein DFH27DRAFT_218835 [Peziza echinospora]|nr:hypothetical protein DFH27DRAFT_218835 [Peziza echinospora]